MTRVFGGRRGRVALCLTAVVGLLSAVTVLAVTGSREPAAALKLLNGDAWLANASAGTASHVNGYTGKVDGQVGIGTAGDPFQIVERPNGAYALDLKTGRLVRLDSATLSAGQSTTPRLRGATSGLQIVTATNASWVIDTTSGIVQQVDPSTLAAIGPQIPLGAPTGRATSDDTGTLWVPVPAKGRVDAITASGQLTSHPFGHSGDQVQVADTSSGVWAVDATAGHAQSLTVPQAHPVSFPSVRGRGSPIVGADPSAPYVVVVENLTAASPGQAVRDTSQVLVINTTQSSLSSVTSPAAAPATQVVVSGDQAYLLDAAANQLQTVNLTRTNFQAPVAVPAGSNQLVSKDQLVFVNNSDSPQALVVNAAGHVTPITKYTPTLPAPNRARPGSQSPPSPAPPSNFGGGPVTPTPPSGNHYGFNPRPHGPSPLPSPGPSVPTIPRTPVVSTPPAPLPTPTPPPPPLTPPPTTT
ncbi:MAG: hypothetical protein J2P57_15720, partial [Acidimicrobiaceae bacterium]|nr:hypothetical protein [Acidimicrobiaceae bacterium]